MFQCGEERVCYDAGHIEAHDSGLGDSNRRNTGECKYSSNDDDGDGYDYDHHDDDDHGYDDDDDDGYDHDDDDDGYDHDDDDGYDRDDDYHAHTVYVSYLLYMHFLYTYDVMIRMMSCRKLFYAIPGSIK